MPSSESLLVQTATMHDSYSTLYPNEFIGRAVSKYADSFSASLPGGIMEHHKKIADNDPMAYFMVSPLEGKFIRWIATMTDAKRGRSRLQPLRL